VFVAVTPERQKGLAERLAKADIRVPPVRDGKMKLWLNASVLNQPEERILAAFVG
jgi:hypothetical protein